MDIDFTPKVDEKVEVFGYKGRFVIEDRKVGDDGHYLFRLESLNPGLTLDGIRYPMMTCPPEEKVRKVLPQILDECGPWPDDFVVGRYDVKFDEMYDGTPRVMVYFHLKPNVIPSPDKARVWNNFYLKLREKFQFVDVDPEHQSTRIQFSAKEERSALLVAS
ncbi:MAG: hypothetical protein ABR907_00180 [Terracidiphilus sp.]|jgi:hypothetical protein